MATRPKGGGSKKSSARSGAPSAPHPQLFPAESADGGEGRVMYSLPSRFKAFSEPDRNMVMLIDEETGKQVPVAIGAYGEVRRVLGALFGGEAEEATDYVPPSVEPLTEIPEAPAEEPAPAPATRPRSARAEQRAAKAAKAEVVRIPRPEKKLFGVALKSYKRKWLVAHGYDENQEAVIDKSAAPTAAGKETVSATVAPERAVKATPSRSKPGRKAGGAAAKGRDETFEEAKPRGKATEMPEGWEPVIEGEGYRLEYGLDPQMTVPAYKVLVGDEVVGWVRQEAPQRFVLYSPTGVFTESVHRNVLGAQTRLDVMYEPVE